MHVLTTSLADNEFIFGGRDQLVRCSVGGRDVCAPADGGCRVVAMIIGEDLQSAILDAGIAAPAIAVDIHAGFRENIDGVVAALEPAAADGLDQRR